MSARHMRGRARPRRLWPEVDHYELLEPEDEQSHPVEAVLECDPAIRRTYRRVRRLQERISVAEGQ